MSEEYQRPLSDVRVLDFGQYIAGPAAAMCLGDLGAEVIRVDPPGGPRWRSPAAAMLNRGKVCIELDLKTKRDLYEAIRLVQSADVLIENFRPRVMNRLGLGAAQMRSANPGLIYLSLPGFSSKDDERAQIPAWEAIVAAACGQYSDMGLNRVLMGIEPSFSPLPLASAYAAVLGAGSATLALVKRTETGRGDAIEVPLASALMEGLAYTSQQIEDLPERYKSNREKEIDRRRENGSPMNVSYDELQELMDPFYRNFECADGRQIYIVSAGHSAHPERVLRALGLWDQLIAEGLPSHTAYLDVADWPQNADCTVRAYPLSQRWARRVATLMKQSLRAKRAFEWERVFCEHRVPAAAQRTTHEWIHSEHALKVGSILKVNDPDYGEMFQIGNLAWLKSEGETVLHKATRSRSRTAGFTPRKSSVGLAISQSEKGWLNGLKVVDTTNVIAGPTIASTLARFGAEVIKIDPVVPDMDPSSTIICGMQAGRGKRSLLLDLKSAKGREVLDRLLKWTDVITANSTDKQLADIGLDPNRIKDVNPGLILCQIDCFGGPRYGPRSNCPGYDDLAQASTGIMARFGGSLSTPEEHAHIGTIDVLCGFSGIMAIGAALLQRTRTNKGDVARASLCAAGQLIQVPFMYDYRGRGPFDEPSGPKVNGWGPLYHAYRASDGWFFLATEEDRLVDLEAASGLQGIRSMSAASLERRLADRFQSQPLSYWIPLLRNADIGAHTIDKMQNVRDMHLVLERDGGVDLDGPTFAFIGHDRHPSGRWVDLVAPNAVRPAEAEIQVPTPMPKPGADSREILRELGFRFDEIEQMIIEGVTADQWCDKYLPA